MTTAVALLVIMLSSCGGSSSTSTGRAAGDAGKASTTAGPASSTTTSLVVPPVSVPPSKDVVHLTDVRIGTHDGKDRVTFQFDTGLPGYSFTEGSAPIPTGEGASNLRLGGPVWITAKFSQASATDLTGGIHKTYTGSSPVAAKGAVVVTDAAQASDSEGDLTWGIGLQTTAAMKVTTLALPPRVVIDVG